MYVVKSSLVFNNQSLGYKLANSWLARLWWSTLVRETQAISIIMCDYEEMGWSLVHKANLPGRIVGNSLRNAIAHYTANTTPCF